MHLSLKRTAVACSIILAASSLVALAPASATPRGGQSVPPLKQTDLTSDFSAMAKLKGLADKGKGKIAVLLPDTQSSARYVQFDAPYLKQAFEAAGLSSSDYQIQNAQGSTRTMQTQADAAITNGASVLLVDPLDSGSGAAIEKSAKDK